MIVPLRGVERHLPETGNVTSSAYSSDSGGGATGITTVGADIPCRIDALGGVEEQSAARVSDRSTHLITIQAETPIDAGQIFSIDGLGSYEILAVRSSSDELARSFEVVEQA